MQNYAQPLRFVHKLQLKKKKSFIILAKKSVCVAPRCLMCPFFDIFKPAAPSAH